MKSYMVLAGIAGLTIASPSSDITLKPATRDKGLTRRSSDISLRRSLELTYSEGVTHRQPLEAQYELVSSHPVLLLEDFDHLFRDVRCEGNTMSIEFRNRATHIKARETCEELKGGIIVSSHFSCSEEGKHSFYRVNDFDFDEQGSTIRFETESRTLEESFESINFHLGRSSERTSLHQHDRLYRRQESSNSVGIASSTAPPEAMGTHEATVQLDFENTNSTFLDFLDLPIDFGCKNCSSTGQLELTTVDLALHNPFGSDDDDDPVETGSIQFDLKGFALSIGLRAVLSEPIEHLIPIFSSPRIGINAGLASAGLGFELGINMIVDVANYVELGFGFDVEIEDASLLFDLAETQNSRITGLDETKITNKVLEANSSDISVTLAAGLQSAITFGITIGIVEVAAGPYMELPRLNMTVSQVSTDNVGANCEAGGATDDQFKEDYKNLTLVEYNMGIVAGFKAEIGPLFETDFDLFTPAPTATTQCLAWKTEGSDAQFTPATGVLAVITGGPGADKKGDTGAATSLHNPFIGTLGAGDFGIKALMLAACAIFSLAVLL